MKNALIALFTLAAISIQAQATWKVDLGHSSINFAVSHMLISETTGHFEKFDIEAQSNEKLENPTVNVTIDAASINTNMSMRDDHLRAPDFFDVEKYPNIIFKSTSFEDMGDGKFKLMGDITIKDVTKPITFEGKLNGIIDNPHSGGKTAGLKLTTSVQRADFGVGEKGGSIGDEVEVTINLEMGLEK